MEQPTPEPRDIGAGIPQGPIEFPFPVDGVFNPPVLSVQNDTHYADGRPILPELSALSPETFTKVLGDAAQALKTFSTPEE